MKCYTIEEINKTVRGKLTGDIGILITGVERGYGKPADVHRPEEIRQAMATIQ